MLGLLGGSANRLGMALKPGNRDMTIFQQEWVWSGAGLGDVYFSRCVLFIPYQYVFIDT